MEPIQDLAQRWLALDQDESTRKEIQDLVQANNVSELESRLCQRIAFGTAGLRSSMKAGFAHMNSVRKSLEDYVLSLPSVHYFCLGGSQEWAKSDLRTTILVGNSPIANTMALLQIAE